MGHLLGVPKIEQALTGQPEGGTEDVDDAADVLRQVDAGTDGKGRDDGDEQRGNDADGYGDWGGEHSYILRTNDASGKRHGWHR